MRTPLLEILREIPDHRRVEGRRFDLATVLLYSIVAMGGANSYRQMHEFIRIHRQSLNAAFGLELRYAPSYTGLRLILHGVIRRIGERLSRHASTLAERPRPKGFGRSRWTANPARQLRRLLRPQGRAYDDGVRHADQIVLAHVMVAEKSNEIPTAPELIEALGVKDRLFTLDAEHCQKNRSRA